MSAPAIVRRAGGLVAFGAALAGVHLGRRQMLRWGATQEEVDAHYGDEALIPGAPRASVMATTFAAPPAAVWPWLVQMGCDRAGFYSWDRLDNGGDPSADRIHPEWQDLQQGGRILAVPDEGAWFDVAVLEPERTLILRSSLALPKATHFDPAGRPPRANLSTPMSRPRGSDVGVACSPFGALGATDGSFPRAAPPIPRAVGSEPLA